MCCSSHFRRARSEYCSIGSQTYATRRFGPSFFLYIRARHLGPQNGVSVCQSAEPCWSSTRRILTRKRLAWLIMTMEHPKVERSGSGTSYFIILALFFRDKKSWKAFRFCVNNLDKLAPYRPGSLGLGILTTAKEHWSSNSSN